MAHKSPWIVLLLTCLCLPLVVESKLGVTHRCSLRIDATPAQQQQQEYHLSCKAEPDAPPSCKLVVYYNDTVALGGNSLLIRPPFGVPSAQLPSPIAGWNTAQFNDTELPLNRTEPIYNATVWPMLFFHGGHDCNVFFQSPFIKGVQLAIVSGEATTVLAFGGGLSATLDGGLISNNTALVGVTVLANSTLTIKGTSITSNSVVKGALYSSWSSRLLVDNATLSGNTAQQHGAAMYLVGSNALVVNTSVHSNLAFDGGGGLYVKGASRLTMKFSEIFNNTSPTGGGLSAYDQSTVAVAQQCKFNNNKARTVVGTPVQDQDLDQYYKLGVGGAMYLERSFVNITDTEIHGNRAVMDGGAVRMQLGQLTIKHSNLSSNIAHRHGGGLYVGSESWDKTVNSTVWVENTTLDTNVAQSNGGAMMLQRRCHAAIINSTLKDCQAWSAGGGICTVMGNEDGGDKLSREEDRKTNLTVADVQFVFQGKSADDKLYVGPYFELRFSNLSQLNSSSDGVVWRKRLCDKGEYVSASQYCEECPSYQFSTAEGSPGHSLTSCQQAPPNTIAPGGAVLVPIAGGWHGVVQSVHECEDCPPLNVTLEDIRRCPNPLACEHNATLLAEQHPNSRSGPVQLSWPAYGDKLCNSMEGYTGVLCGVCIKGWGTTAPFKCNRCLGASNAQPPGPLHISLLYLAYWLVLTCWLLLCVRFSNQIRRDLRRKQGKSPTTGGPPAETTAGHPQVKQQQEEQPGAPLPAVSVDVEARQHNNTSNAAGKNSTSRSKSSSRGARSLDITKALVIYTQWVMLIINLPVNWIPWSMKPSSTGSGATTQIPDTVQTKRFMEVIGWAVGIIFGRSASVDCFLQAWDYSQDDVTQHLVKNVFARALGSAVVVPLILFTSVLLLQLLLFSLRRPTLAALDRLCNNSQFFRRHIAGRLGAVPSAQSAQSDLSSTTGFDEESPCTAAVNSASSLASGPSTMSIFSLSSNEQRATRATFSSVLKDNIVATALATSMFVYITIAKVAFGMLLCVRVGPSERWVLDVRLQCPAAETPPAWGAAAICLGVVLLCICIAWPVGIAWVLVRAAHRGMLLRFDPARASKKQQATASDADALLAAHTTARLAVRYADYDVKYEALLSSGGSDGSRTGWHRSWSVFRWTSSTQLRLHAVLVWDSILDLHRLTVALVSVCVMLHELHQLILMVLVLGSYLVLVLLVRPWRSAAVWQLQVLALVILLASCLGIMACTLSDASAYYSAAAKAHYTTVIPWLIVAVNLCYLVLLVVLLMRCVVREVPRLADLRHFLGKRFHIRNIRKFKR